MDTSTVVIISIIVAALIMFVMDMLLMYNMYHRFEISRSLFLTVGWLILSRLLSVRRLMGGTRCLICGSGGPPLIRIDRRLAKRVVSGFVGPFCRRCVAIHPLVMQQHSCGFNAWRYHDRRTKW